MTKDSRIKNREPRTTSGKTRKRQRYDCLTEAAQRWHFQTESKMDLKYLSMKLFHFWYGLKILLRKKQLQEERNTAMRVSERPKVGSQFIKNSMPIKELAKDMGRLLLLTKDYSICILFVQPINWVGGLKTLARKGSERLCLKRGEAFNITSHYRHKALWQLLE